MWLETSLIQLLHFKTCLTVFLQGNWEKCVLFLIGVGFNSIPTPAPTLKKIPKSWNLNFSLQWAKKVNSVDRWTQSVLSWMQTISRRAESIDKKRVQSWLCRPSSSSTEFTRPAESLNSPSRCYLHLFFWLVMMLELAALRGMGRFGFKVITSCGTILEIPLVELNDFRVASTEVAKEKERKPRFTIQA